jgi:hypothetical protein
MRIHRIRVKNFLGCQEVDLAGKASSRGGTGGEVVLPQASGCSSEPIRRTSASPRHPPWTGTSAPRSRPSRDSPYRHLHEAALPAPRPSYGCRAQGERTGRLAHDRALRSSRRQDSRPRALSALAARRAGGASRAVLRRRSTRRRAARRRATARSRSSTRCGRNTSGTSRRSAASRGSRSRTPGARRRPRRPA